MGAVAWADVLQSDGDDLVPFSDSNINFGEVCTDATVNQTVLHAIKRTGGVNNQTFANGATVTVSVTGTAGDGLSAVMGADNTIVLPGDWEDQDNNTLSADSATSTVTFVAPTTPSSFTGTVNYSASGAGVAGSRPDDLTVTAEVVDCGAPNTPPTVDAGGGAAGYNGDEGSAIPLDGTVNDPDGDPVTSLWSYAAGAGVDSGATCSFGDAEQVDTTITCTDDGTYTVTLTADDAVNPEVSDSATVTVANVAPSVGQVTGPTGPVAVDTSINVSAPFTDAGTNDTHTCTIDWGDTSTDTVVDPATSPCATSHSYGAAGIYTVSVTVADDDGDSDTGYFQYVVVYDPSAGFVTGGGWISSPEGAYVADPSLTGKATFGFVAKYKKGANVPDGNTEFQFHAGSLNFKSTSYEWLVVSGQNKAQFKGVGTINGSGQYSFLLSVIDGGNTGDKFRIKIWDADDNVIYDNNVANGDIAAEPATFISGGNIVIHVPKK